MKDKSSGQHQTIIQTILHKNLSKLRPDIIDKSKIMTLGTWCVYPRMRMYPDLRK